MRLTAPPLPYRELCVHITIIFVFHVRHALYREDRLTLFACPPVPFACSNVTTKGPWSSLLVTFKVKLGLRYSALRDARVRALSIDSMT